MKVELIKITPQENILELLDVHKREFPNEHALLMQCLQDNDLLSLLCSSQMKRSLNWCRTSVLQICALIGLDICNKIISDQLTNLTYQCTLHNERFEVLDYREGKNPEIIFERCRIHNLYVNDLADAKKFHKCILGTIWLPKQYENIDIKSNTAIRAVVCAQFNYY